MGDSFKGAEHYGEERLENDEAKAERIIREGLKKSRRKVGELERRLKGDPEKVKMAQRLRRDTVRPVAWIAERLRLGTRNYANYLLSNAGAEK